MNISSNSTTAFYSPIMTTPHITIPPKCPSCSLALNHEGPCKKVTRGHALLKPICQTCFALMDGTRCWQCGNIPKWNPEENEGDGPWNEPEDGK